MASNVFVRAAWNGTKCSFEFILGNVERIVVDGLGSILKRLKQDLDFPKIARNDQYRPGNKAGSISSGQASSHPLPSSNKIESFGKRSAMLPA